MRAGPLIDGVRRQLPLAEKVGLVFTNVFRSKLVWRSFEVACKIFDGAQVCACCTLGVISTLELFEHHLSKLGHRDLLVTRQDSNGILPTHAPTLSVCR